MFLFEKYRPKTIKDIIFNKNLIEQLIYMAHYEDIPHIIIAGPQGGGKKTLLKFFLEALYDSDVNILTKIKYHINGSSTKKEIEIMQSNYHIIIEPTNTNHDKYILQEIIKQYTMHKMFNIFKTKRKFKTIVIHNIENLANNSQSALRRTMELYAKTCRFVMICNDLSKIFDPLKSRCRTFCVPLPSEDDIHKVLTYIATMENMPVNFVDIDMIVKNCDDNLKKAIWILDCKRFDVNEQIALDKIFDHVVDLIMNIRKEKYMLRIFDNDIRSIIYKILITIIKGSEIITMLMNKLIRRINDDKINARIIQAASEAEYNLIHGRRDIIDIDFFIISVIRELKGWNGEDPKIDRKLIENDRKLIENDRKSKN